MPVPLDIELKAIVDMLVAKGAPRAFAGTVSEARYRLETAITGARSGARLPAVARQQDTIAEWSGIRVAVRIYKPVVARTRATVVYAHPGGFALGSVELFDESARILCSELGSTIVSVDYRLAPENPFPAAHEDVWAAARWTVKNAAELGGDIDNIALAGESAGANLVANASHRLRDECSALSGQLLIVPGVNFAREIGEGASAPMLTGKDLADTRRLLFGERSIDLRACPPSPIFASRFSGLAPAVIAVAGHDLLHDEGVAYAQKLSTAQVDTTLLEFESMHHTFFGFVRASSGAQRAVTQLCAAFRQKLLASQKV
jgi:acetyl esterase